MNILKSLVLGAVALTLAACPYGVLTVEPEYRYAHHPDGHRVGCHFFDPYNPALEIPSLGMYLRNHSELPDTDPDCDLWDHTE